MQKPQNQNRPFFLFAFFFFLAASISIPLQAQKDDAYEDEYAGLLSRMVEKGYSTYENNDFLGPVEYWQKLWDRVNGTSTWTQLMDNVVLKQAQRTESNGSTGITKALLTRSDRVAWIAFPGVGEDDDANLESGVINDFPKWRNHSDMDVQKYFFNEYEGLKPQIATWMATHKNEFDKVIVTGHSKGGALSQYFLADFLDLYPDKLFHLIAFGSPNGGNENFINYWANKSNLVRAKFYTTKGWFVKFPSGSYISDIITYNEVSPGRVEAMFAISFFLDNFGARTYYPRGLARKTDKYITDYSEKLVRQHLKVEGGVFGEYGIWENYAMHIHDDSYYLTGLQNAFNSHELETIRPNDISTHSGPILLASSGKCIDNYTSRTVEGNNIQIYTCKSNHAAQTWKFQGNQIKLTSNPAYCLDVKNASAIAGTNVQLASCRWDPNTPIQQWVYDGRTRLFHYLDAPNLCLAVNGSNVQLSTCSEGSGNQQWLIDNTFTNGVIVTGKATLVKRASDPELCIYPEEGRTRSNSPFSTQSVDGSIDQGLIFNANGSISIAKRPDRCLDLAGGKTDYNTEIQVIPCTGYDSQQWFYDGFNKAIRNVRDYHKCLQAGENGERLVIKECSNVSAQQFIVAQELSIHLDKNDAKCIDMASNEQGGTLRVHDCAENGSQYYIFDGPRIRRADNPNLCVDIHTTNAGEDIRLWPCNDIQIFTRGQAWYYDAISRRIHSNADPTKCMDFNYGNTANGTNIKLDQCKDVDAQKFVLK